MSDKMSSSTVQITDKDMVAVYCQREIDWIKARREEDLARRVANFISDQVEYRTRKANSLLGRILRRTVEPVTQEQIDAWLDGPQWGSFYTPRQETQHWYQKAEKRLVNIRNAVLSDDVKDVRLSIEDYNLINGRW